MATYDVTDQTSARRVQFTGNGTAGPFAFAFQVNATSEVKVYVDTTEKTETTHYTVSLNSGTGAGTISFTTGNHPTSSQTITILGDIPLSRTSIYTSGGQLTASSLEDDFDTNMFIHQQTNEEINRSLRLAEHDVISGADMTLPVKDTRKGTVLGFNATTGNPEAGPSITSVQSLADIATAINLLGTSAVVEDLGILGTTAIVEDMALLGTSSNVTAMGLLGVSSVITDMSILGTSAIVEDMGILATSANVTAMGVLGTSANVTAMGKLGNDATVADMAILGTDAVVANMATLATSDIIADLNTLATSDIVTDMNLLATSANVTAMGILGTSANVTAMGLLGTSAVVEDLGLLATSAVIEDMALLATSAVIEDMGILATSSNVTAMANVSGSITNVNTVASNLASVNNFGEVYRISSSAPTTSLDLGDLYFDTTSDTLKVYGASGWQNAGSSINGTSQRYHYDITGTPTSVTGADANGNTLTYDAGFVDVYVNGVRMSTADVTVTSGDTVTFAEALANGDEVDIVGFGTFSVASLNADNLDSGTVPDARITGAYTGITNLTMSGNLTVDTNTLYVDSANNRVGIGTSTVNNNLHILGSSGLRIVNSDDTTNLALLNFDNNESPALSLYSNDTTTVRVHSEGTSFFNGGNVGIGTSSPTVKLDIVDDGVQLRLANSTTGTTTSDGSRIQLSGNDLLLVNRESANMQFYTADTERMRIDSSGNLLVSATTITGFQSSNTESGTIAYNAGGIASNSPTNDVAGVFNRLGNDGVILQLKKSGSTVGSINSASGGYIAIGQTNTFLQFHDSIDAIYASDGASGRDNAIDLGTSIVRFDDIYATNGTIQTSDQQEKNTITESDLGIDFIKRLTPKSYIFNGKTRTHYGLIAQDVETVLGDISKPTSGFAGFIKDDISEEQDGSEYRYGLRYTEFVAPLIQAVKDQQATIDAQQTTITALEARITALENAE